MARPLDVETHLGPQFFILLEFTGHEHLSRLSEFTLRLKCKQPDITPQQMLGQNLTARVELFGNKARYFNGYITRWTGVTEQRDSLAGAKETRAYVYEATVSPWLWCLTRQSNSRIFQNKTVPQIVEEVFKAYGGLASFKQKLNGRYRDWEYCCQYRETDFNFVARLMEQEGIYWFVEHENGKHSVTLVDSSSAHEPYPGYDEVRFDREDRSRQELLSTWQGRHEIQPDRYVVDDYDPLKPRTTLQASAARQARHSMGSFEFFDWPAEYEKPSEGESYARIRIGELDTQAQTFAGSGNVRGFQPGCSFTLARHPVETFNGKQLVVGAVYSATGNAETSGASAGFDFSCSITAIPFNTQYRPPRITPKPVAQGPQTATVVGPAGEEIYTDEHGRIKVQFRWDRYGTADQNASCWIRVSQAWAGNGYGAIALPRLGQEVIVEFLEGDPDSPIVTGSVYNGENKPPYKLPAEKTRWGLKSRSSKGGGAGNFNELRFEDKMGSEEVYLHAEKDQTLYTRKKRTEFVGDESHLNVKKDLVEKLEADVHRDVQGDEMVKLGGGFHVKTASGWEGKIGSKFAVDAGQEIHLKAGATLVLEAGSRLSLKVGGNFIDINPGGVFIKGTMVMVNSGGSAGSGSGASPKAPKNAEAAHDSEGGTDKPISQKAAVLKAARASSTPFCEICNS
ncbi:type VI secretion system tip protein VgrG [Ramlibacter sp. XY19]|uniref:type VI secretion system Vgr family protein n=1 Tax=Ramlibacter paludis TaxID=2908000 RepID=UPI0023DC8781|nr:type VI secretion system tip protein TssI/VgrG [Ramlibacter paludis]MCG2595105.1 type VI secretion system tip protein VgrG [Ramlibacter paludis]